MVLYFQSRRHPHRMNYSQNSNKKSEEEKKCVHFILFFSLSSLVCKKAKKRENELHWNVVFLMIVLENSISQNGAEFVALVETEKKSQFLFFSSSSSFSSLQAALMCGNSRSNSHQRNGSWLAHNSVQECRHFAEKGNVFSHKNPT